MQVRVSEPLYEAVRFLAESDGRSVSGWVREVLRSVVEVGASNLGGSDAVSSGAPRPEPPVSGVPPSGQTSVSADGGDRPASSRRPAAQLYRCPRPRCEVRHVSPLWRCPVHGARVVAI